MTKVLMIARHLCLAGLIAAISPAAMAVTTQQKNMLMQLDQLDELDHQDFLEYRGEARRCIAKRDFACAEGAIAKASKLAGNSADKNALRSLQNELASERRQQAEEFALAEASERRRKAQEEREEQEEAAREEEARAESRRQSEQESEPSTALVFKAVMDQALDTYSKSLDAKRLQLESVRREQQRVADERRDRQRAADDLREQQKASAQRQAQTRRQESIDRQSQLQRDAELKLALQERADAAREREIAERKRQEAERNRQAQELRDEAERKRLAVLELARKKAEKEQEANADRERKAAYLVAMERGIKLGALHCPGGKGSHYIVGSRPRIKPEEVSCIDVSYSEICPGSAVGSTGVIKNFLGAGTDCFFGDAAEVSPTPGCKPNQARVTVTRVTACGG